MSDRKHVIAIMIAFALVFGMSLTGSCQFKEAPSTSKGRTSVYVDSTIVVDGVSFEIQVSTKTGNCKYLRTSKKTGTKYSWYLGYKTGLEHDNKAIYRDAKDTKYWYLAVSDGNLKRKYLVKE